MRYLLALLIGTVAACGGGDDGTDAPGSCRATADALAARNADCAVESGFIDSGQRQPFYDNFRAGITTTLDCSRMTKILGSPEACVSETNAMPCATFDRAAQFLPLPASCKGLYGK